MARSFLLAIVLIALLVSRCAAQTSYAAIRDALELALFDGGCTDCDVPEADSCPTSIFSSEFSAGQILCDDTGQFLKFLRIDPTYGTATTIGNLTSLNATSFLVGDTGISFRVTNFARLETLIIDNGTSFGD